MSQNDPTPHTSLPTDKELVLKVIPLPSDTNGNGDIFGGWVMSQVDLAGSVLCARVAQGRIATVAVNEFIFKQPVRVGDLLSFYSSVLRTGRTSITVQVEVFAVDLCRDRGLGERFRDFGGDFPGRDSAREFALVAIGEGEGDLGLGHLVLLVGLAPTERPVAGYVGCGMRCGGGAVNAGLSGMWLGFC